MQHKTIVTPILGTGGPAVLDAANHHDAKVATAMEGHVVLFSDSAVPAIHGIHTFVTSLALGALLGPDPSRAANPVIPESEAP